MAEAEANEHLADDTKGDDEDLMSKHRQERRELQAKIQQLKKSINKNDKNRKKKVDAEIHELEEAFAKRWANFDEAKVKTTDNNQSEVNQNADVPQTSAVADQKQNVSRKARRLANKEKRHNEALANEEVIDYENQPDAIRRRDESTIIDEQLAERGLELRPIASDGNCLFASIVDQDEQYSVRKLRETIADYLRKHRKEFEPFIEADFNDYCDKLAKENVWGGQIELQVCANILQRSIEVIQGNGKEPIRIECPLGLGSPIVLTYHRYLYTNGEHYNSTMPLSE